MKLPPYARTNKCPECRAAIYVPAEERQITTGSRTRSELRPLDAAPEGAPAVISACRCAWLRATVRRAVEGVAA
jgi:hypothetical protein